MIIGEVVRKLVEGGKPTRDEAAGVFREIMEGLASPALTGSFLTALRFAGEDAEVITGAALVMREKSLKINPRKRPVADTCGTGGDCAGTFNISTSAAIIAAACGVSVAKHGNRAVSSRCGSADVLERLGMKIDATPEKAEKMLESCGFTFLFAPAYHPAMKNVAPVRKELGFRTIFNIIGPLCNPAAADIQILGVGSRSLLDVIPGVLSELGLKKGWVFFGEDGVDEISVSGKTLVVEIGGGKIRRFEITPEDFGFRRSPVKELEGGSPDDNAGIFRAVIEGTETGSRRDAALLNAGALIFLSGLAGSVNDGIEAAGNAVRSGKAATLLDKVIEFSRDA